MSEKTCVDCERFDPRPIIQNPGIGKCRCPNSMGFLMTQFHKSTDTACKLGFIPKRERLSDEALLKGQRFV